MIETHQTKGTPSAKGTVRPDSSNGAANSLFPRCPNLHIGVFLNITKRTPLLIDKITVDLRQSLRLRTYQTRSTLRAVGRCRLNCPHSGGRTLFGVSERPKRQGSRSKDSPTLVAAAGRQPPGGEEDIGGSGFQKSKLRDPGLHFSMRMRAKHTGFIALSGYALELVYFNKYA
jgi:hypothetical protein